MKPAPFDYAAPESLEEALELLAEHGSDAKVLAGGQSLVPILNFRLARPALLVDLNGIEELTRVRRGDDGGLELGAMTRQRRLERDLEVARRAPLLAEAMPHVAHPQIRNRGTLGGSLAHADPAAELPAVAVALDARFRLARRGGERWVPAKEFFVGLMTTALEPEEILAGVALPPAAPRTGHAFAESARRHGDYAAIGVAATLRLDAGGRIEEARLVYLSAGDVPCDAVGAAASLAGRAPGEEAFAEAASLAREEVEPTADVHAGEAYKRHLAEVLARRTLGRAARRAAGAEEG